MNIYGHRADSITLPLIAIDLSSLRIDREEIATLFIISHLLSESSDNLWKVADRTLQGIETSFKSKILS